LDLKSFINREQGHYIINLEQETNGLADSNNESFIQKFYISPPGEVDYTSITEGGVIVNTSTSDVSTDNLNTANFKVINKSLQTHFVFKIVTREEDVNAVMTSANI